MPSDILRAIARLTLCTEFSEAEIDALVRAFSLERVRPQMIALGVCEPDASDALIAKLYFSRRCSIVSPNHFFDEAWYLEQYEDVRDAVRSGGLISGFVHFIKDGLRTGRWPNSILHAAAIAHGAPAPPREQIDADFYLARNPVIKPFLAAFPSLTPLEHYNAYGRFLGFPAGAAMVAEPVPAQRSLALQATEAEFDPEYYAERYLRLDEDAQFRADPFEHYVKRGMRLGHSPNAWFQEDWYRAFYAEVRDAIGEGWLPSGFYHYVMSGRIEGRLPRYDLTAALEARLPGLTDPSLLKRAEALRRRLAGMDVLPECEASSPRTRTIWFFLPMLNPDVVYGGYRAALEFICALRRDGYNVAIVTTEEVPNKPYFLWGEPSTRVRQAFADVNVLSMEAFSSGTIGDHDLFIAYAVWDLHACAQLSERTLSKKPMLLLQEYEPIFHANGAQRTLCEGCYDIPHYPIINSGFLLKYLKQHGLSVFGQDGAARLGRDYAVFEHKVNLLPVQTAATMSSRQRRILAVYARPEAHAARNLLELVIIALQALCTAGAFGAEWSFIGVGALSRVPPVQLGGGHELVLRQKLPEEEYRQMMAGMDIGISLMSAPHPSVMPFEFATTGALVITNTYENRSESELRQICANIIPCRQTVSSLGEALREALARVADVGARERNALRPVSVSWNEIFSEAFLENIIDSVSGDGARREAVVVDIPVQRMVRPAQAVSKVTVQRDTQRGKGRRVV